MPARPCTFLSVGNSLTEEVGEGFTKKAAAATPTPTPIIVVILERGLSSEATVSNVVVRSREVTALLT